MPSEKWARVVCNIIRVLLVMILLLLPWQVAAKTWFGLTILMGLFLLFHTFLARDWHIVRGGLAKPLLSILVVACVAGLFSLSPAYSARHGLETFGGPLLVYAAILRVVIGRDDETTQRRRWISLIAYPTAVSLLGNLVYGFVAMARGQGGAASDTRFHGGFFWYAEEARYLEVAVFLTFGFFLYVYRKKPRVLSISLLLVVAGGMAGLLLTKTKGAFVGFAAGAFVFALLCKQWILLGAFFLGGCILTAVFPSFRAEAAKMISVERFTTASSTAPFRYRPHGWKYTWEKLSDRPLLGHGPGGKLFRQRMIEDGYTVEGKGDEALIQHRGPEQASSLAIVDNPHNFLLQLLYEMGLLGGVAFGWLLASFCTKVRESLRPGNPSRGLALGVTAALTAAVVHGMVSTLYTDSVFVLLVAALSVIDLTHDDRDHAQAS